MKQFHSPIQLTALTLFALLFTFTAMAQRVRVNIIDSGELYSTYYLAGNVEEKAQIKRELGAATLTEILQYSMEDSWPEGISTLDNRNANREEMSSYVAYRITTIDEHSILVLPASENAQMPKAMRPTRDIYWIIGNSGIEVSSDQPAENSTLVPAKIIDPMQLLSNFDVRINEAFNNELGSALSREQYEYIAKMSHEEAWPAGIATFEEREKIRPTFKDYTAYYAGNFGSSDEAYTLLYIPVIGNEHMPRNMRPTEDIFFVYKSFGVQVDGITTNNQREEVEEPSSIQNEYGKYLSGPMVNDQYK